jgi:predicted XRE-type DNA-binding protein
MKKRDTTVIRGSGNIFADLGLPDADEHMLKARLVMYIGERINELALTQQAAAKRMGVKQPDVSRILRGHFAGFSLDRLFALTIALGSDVEIKVRRAANDEDRKDRKHEGRMSLMTA